MRRAVGVVAIIGVIGLVLGGCASSNRSVERRGAGDLEDLSGRWNDNDAQIVAEEMVNDVLSRPWLERFESSEGGRPVIVVGEVRNLSSEHIDTGMFVRSIERELLNSGAIRFVAGEDARKIIREERKDQQTQARPETVSRLGEETGADFLLRGAIRSSQDAVEGKRAVTYQVDMELINIESNEIVWIGSTEIRKMIEQSGMSW